MENKSIWDADLYPVSFSTLKENITTDILIIGAGISGLSCAYELLDQGAAITIVDQNAVYQGTTPRTTAKITWQHGYIYHDLIRKRGWDKARLYYEFNQSGINRIAEIVSRENIACDFRTVNGYLFALADKERENIEREAAAYDKLDIPYRRARIDPRISAYEALQAAGQANFNITKYLRRIVVILVARGVAIYENTRIVDLHGNGEAIAVTAGNKRIRAKNVIVCNHYPVYKKFNFFFTKMIPYYSYSVVAASSVVEIEDANYINTVSPSIALRFITHAGQRKLNISGASHEAYKFKQPLTEISFLKKFGKENLGVADYQYAWFAQDYATTDLLPLIGRIKDNIFVATSYNKWGMAIATAGAMMIKDLLTKNASGYTALFNPTRMAINCKFLGYNLKVVGTLLKTRSIPKRKVVKLKPDSAVILKKQGKRIGIYKDPEHKLYIVDITCPHMRCGLRFNKLARTYDCKCHGSRFTYDGKLIDGPALKDLRRIATSELHDYLE